MPRGKTHSVGDLVGGVLRKWEAQAGGPIERIILAWAEVVGEPIATNSRPVETEATTLIVEVRDTIWRDQLARFYKKKIIERLNDRLGARLVRDIRFRVGRDSSQWETQ
jgi:predicted nucleic acid-binding Zn ribbon protein